jgi:pantetheine-phosphate adenylyltransferase
MNKQIKIGVYPGTFDPITNGHVDVIKSALKVVDKLIIAVAADTTKNPIFSAEERTDLVQHEINNLGDNLKERVTALAFSGLLVDFCHNVNAEIIIRGLRVISDFEYEYQMSCVNTKLAQELQTIFIPASDKTQFISSRFVKEVARLNGNLDPFVSDYVGNHLKQYYGAK